MNAVNARTPIATSAATSASTNSTYATSSTTATTARPRTAPWYALLSDEQRPSHCDPREELSGLVPRGDRGRRSRRELGRARVHGDQAVGLRAVGERPARPRW